MMLFYLMFGLAPHGLDLGFLGLGRLGLSWAWPSWAWASSFAKTNKKNFKCFGPCPFLLLITSFWFSSHYVHGSKFKVFSDHKNLKYLFDHKELNMRQWRWMKFLKNYDLELHYHSGKTNVLTDALRRKSLHVSSLMIQEMSL